jgi:hypothetical protein
MSLDCVQWQACLFAVSELRKGIVVILIVFTKLTHGWLIDFFIFSMKLSLLP